jgi:hypothetical protein
MTTTTLTRGTDIAPAVPAMRTFRVTFALLTVHFLSLGVLYLVDPAQAVRGFATLNEALGGVPFAPPDVAPWRFATVCGMTSLAVMTLLLTVDLRRNLPLLWPLAWFKGLNAALWFWYAGTTPGMPVFVVAGLIDVVVVASMVVIARRAHASLPVHAA